MAIVISVNETSISANDWVNWACRNVNTAYVYRQVDHKELVDDDNDERDEPWYEGRMDTDNRKKSSGL